MTLKNRRVFELRLGKLGLILFVSGMSVLLFSLFLIGVVVGKHMEAYPERFTTGIPEMIADRLFPALPLAVKPVSTEAEMGIKEDPPGTEAEVTPTVGEPLEGKKGPAPPEGQPVTAKDKPPEADTGQSRPLGGVARPSTAIPGGAAIDGNRPPTVAGGEETAKQAVPAQEGKPAVDAGVKKKPAAETPAPQKGRYEIQAAAYREKAQADRLAKKLTDFGFPSQVVMKEISGKGQWFRVIVGGFENREKAREAADQLTGKIRGLKCVIRASVSNGNGG